MSRQNVPGPSQQANPLGIFSVADFRAVADVHVLGGITWQSRVPAVATTTTDPCFIGNNVANLSKTTAQYTRGATPFTVFAEIDCSPPGFWDNMDQFINEAFTLAEQAAVEATLMTGSVAATGNVMYPHLASVTNVNDPTTTTLINLQTATVIVTGVPLDIVEGLGRLEDLMMTALNGPGVIHVNPAVFEMLAGRILLKWNNGMPYTQAGNRVVLGVGYSDWTPSGAAAALGTSWLYGTGSLFGYRSAIQTHPDPSVLDRNVNTAHVMAYREYVLGFDGGPWGVEVSLGGNITGTFNSAT